MFALQQNLNSCMGNSVVHTGKRVAINWC